jgi:hypothetical protein
MMGKLQDNQKGFSAIEFVLIVIIITIVAFVGWFVWHSKQTADKNLTITNSATPIIKKQTKATNLYAGWKSYCDTIHYYCFKYPSNWQLTTNGQSDEDQVHLISPTSTVQVTYSNELVKDSSPIPFNTASIVKLSTANQALSVVGGYNPTSGNNGVAGNNIPVYEVVDNSLLSTYPLTVGQTTQFPNNASFTDQYSGQTASIGALTSMPAVTINTVSQAKSWLSSTDAQTSLLILKSIYYEQ